MIKPGDEVMIPMVLDETHKNIASFKYKIRDNTFTHFNVPLYVLERLENRPQRLDRVTVTWGGTKDILDERQQTHGEFAQTALIAQTIKDVLRSGDPELSVTQAEALDNIAVKLARIVSGDPNHADSWEDIIGYCRLALRYNKGEDK